MTELQREIRILKPHDFIYYRVSPIKASTTAPEFRRSQSVVVWEDNGDDGVNKAMAKFILTTKIIWS